MLDSVIEEIEQDIFNGEDINLSSFEIHDDLNREVWDENNKLFPEIRERLLSIAHDFIDTLDLDEIIDVSVKPRDLITDIYFVGSLASYNYSKYADIDLHVVADLTPLGLDVPTAELFKKYFWQCKNDWNTNHTDLTIHGYDVELYVQNANEENAANGVYSIVQDKWLKVPEPMEQMSYNKQLVKQKALDYIDKIDYLGEKLDSGSDPEKIREIAKVIKDKIINSRRHSLELSDNEMTEANIIFKVLRRADYIGKLNDLITKGYDMKNTIKESRVNERNDSAPIYLKDVPADLKETLEREFNVTFHENDMELPYIYVDIPVLRPNPASIIRKQGRPVREKIPNFNAARKREFEGLIEKAGWYILEKLRPDAVDQENYSYVISPYKNPAEPGLDDWDDAVEVTEARNSTISEIEIVDDEE